MSQLQRAGFLLPAGLTGYLWFKGLHPSLPGWPCPLRSLTGLPCPTCFLTRATSSSLQGDWSEALAQHAFGPLVAGALLVWSVQAIRRRRIWPGGLRLRAWQGAAGIGLLLGYWGVRMVLHYRLGIQAFPSP